MKKVLITVVLVVTLSGCFGPSKFDSTNETTIKESIQEIVKDLPQEQGEEFVKSVMYFTMGGPQGLKSMMGGILFGKGDTVKNLMFTINIKSIDGLTGNQILEKYRKLLEEDRLQQEKEEVERSKLESEYESVRKLNSEAEDLLKTNKFEKALDKYKLMGKLSSGVKSSEIGIDKTIKSMKDFTEKMNYIDKIQITEFVAKRIDTYSKEGIPAVRISLKNTGGRSLDKVRVTVYFQDKSGNTIFEEDFLPVLVSKYSFTGNNNPLKSGYVSEMEKDKYYTLDSQLSDWEEGKSVAKVVDLEFSK